MKTTFLILAMITLFTIFSCKKSSVQPIIPTPVQTDTTHMDLKFHMQLTKDTAQPYVSIYLLIVDKVTKKDYKDSRTDSMYVKPFKTYKSVFDTTFILNVVKNDSIAFTVAYISYMMKQASCTINGKDLILKGGQSGTSFSPRDYK